MKPEKGSYGEEMIVEREETEGRGYWDMCDKMQQVRRLLH